MAVSQASVRAHNGASAERARIVDVVRALQEVAEAINEEEFDLDAVLHLVARRLCTALAIGRCTAYLKDPATGLYRGRVMETQERGRDWDRVVRRLTCGLEADRFTHEIVAARGPVFLSDPQADPRAIRSAMRTYGVRSMLGVPMVVRQDVPGLLFLDNLDEPHVFSAADTEIAVRSPTWRAPRSRRRAWAAELRSNLSTIARQNKILRRSSIVEWRLGRLALEGAGPPAATQAVADLTGRPCAVLDTDLRLLAAGQPAVTSGSPPDPLPPPQDMAGLGEALAAAEPSGSVVGPLSPAMPDRLLAASVHVNEEHAGYILIRESSPAFTAIDLAAARRAATIVGLSLSTQRSAAETQAHAREILVRDLIAGVDDERVLTARSRFCRMRLDAPHVVCVISRGGGEAVIGSAELAAAGELDGGGPATIADGALVVLLALDDAAAPRAAVAAARSAVERLLDRLTPGGALVGAVSSPCRTLRDYRRGYDEARQLMRSALSLRPADAGHVVVAADDLGAARLLLAASGREEAKRFAHDALGPLLAPHDPHAGDLLSTLAEYFACSRSIRGCALRLGVHENTVRYRLARVTELTGLEVGSNADDQLVAQVAVLVLRLGGRLPTAQPGR